MIFHEGSHGGDFQGIYKPFIRFTKEKKYRIWFIFEDYSLSFITFFLVVLSFTDSYVRQ